MRSTQRFNTGILCEIQRATGLGLRLQADAIPIRDPVNAVCEMLGYDPLYLACEGRVLAVLDPAGAEAALTAWRANRQGAEAAIIGEVSATAGRVVMQTALGGERILEELEDDPLP
ncbi:MAG: AIR synthase-related protein, partial [Anaerolineales bacterium]